jgi:hypothetical protein
MAFTVLSEKIKIYSSQINLNSSRYIWFAMKLYLAYIAQPSWFPLRKG